MKEQLKKISKKALRFLPDETYLKLRYLVTFHKPLNLSNPKTYNEKLQWMKLYDRNPLYNQLVDKYAVRKFVAERIGEEHLIPCLGIWDSFDEIDFEQLPNQCVIKCTHDSGSVYICRDKSKLDRKRLKERFNKALEDNQYWGGREWAYKDVKGRVIVEQFMVDDSGTGLRDYKFFCFGGKVKSMFIATDRGVEGQEVKFDFFDENFKHLPFKHGHENAKVIPLKPECFEEMITLAEKLSKGLRHVRVDLYNVNGKIYFGEMTFYHHCGFVPFEPKEWDWIFGNWIEMS